MPELVEMQCSCGKKFKRWPLQGDDWCPFDFMCPDCRGKEVWHWHTRMLRLEKFRCVKCGWKLKKKDVVGYLSHETGFGFKCPCCGYTFELHHDEY